MNTKQPTKQKDNVLELKNQVKPQQPKPLPSGKKEVMPFDYDMLPSELQPFVKDVANRLQCPPDFIAVSVLCSLASLLGNQAAIKPKVNDDWLIYPTLWGMFIAPPSAKKTPALKQSLLPMMEIEKQLQREHKETLKSHAIDKEFWSIKKNQAAIDARNFIKNGEDEKAQQVLADISEAEPQEPKAKSLVVNDVTVAKLGEILQDNPKGVLYLRDELGAFLSALSREDNTEARGFLLECYNGNGYFRFDRISRGTTIIENCTLSMLGGVQPSAILPVIREAVKGLRNDGLLQRFQLAVYPQQCKTSDYVDTKINTQVLSYYSQVVNMFYGFDFYQEDNKPRVFSFSGEAQKIFIEWYKQLCKDINNDDYNGAFVSHIQKMDRTIPIIALIFELIATKGQVSTISEVSLAKACEWFEYLKNHAEAIYSMAINSEYDNAKRLLRNKSKLSDIFTVREIRRKHWSGLDENYLIQSSLSLLEDYGYLAEYKDGSNMGRKTSKYYFLR